MRKHPPVSSGLDQEIYITGGDNTSRGKFFSPDPFGCTGPKGYCFHKLLLIRFTVRVTYGLRHNFFPLQITLHI